METSEAKRFHKQAGLTLIEVLIALAITAIALTAVIKAASQAIRSTRYLETKTQAAWVASNIINEARVGLIKLPTSPDKEKQATELLGQPWYWTATREETANSHIEKIIVDVSTSDDEDSAPIITLESFIYHAKTAS